MQQVKSVDGTLLAYDRSGDGPPVILVGAAFNDRTGTAPLAAALAQQLTVINYDRRGRGDSSDTAPYAVEREIEDINTLITETGGSAAVFGYSSGAILALHAAAHGLAITKLALYEPPFLVDDSRPRPPAAAATRSSSTRPNPSASPTTSSLRCATHPSAPSWRPSPTPSSTTRRSSPTSPCPPT